MELALHGRRWRGAHGRTRVLEPLGLRSSTHGATVRSLGAADRLLLGAALGYITRPPVLVLDELDEDTTPEETAAVLNALRALTATGVTVLAGTLDPGLAPAADVALALAADGTPATRRPPLLRRPRLDPAAASATGAPPSARRCSMRSVEIALLELKRLVSARPFRLAVAVVCLVPLLYGVLYLWAFWDPYQRLDKLPVALVVEDRAVRGRRRHRPRRPGPRLGAPQERDLRLGAARVREQAADGLEDGTYYMALTVPRDFSSRLAHADSDHPKKAEAAGAGQRGDQPAGQPDRLPHLPRGRVVALGGDVAEVPRPHLRRPRRRADRVRTRRRGRRQAGARAGERELRLPDARARHRLGRLGARTLHAGLGKLSSGAAKLHGGASDAASGAGQLAAGVRAASSGARSVASAARPSPPAPSRSPTGSCNSTRRSQTLVSSASSLSGGASQVQSGVESAASQTGRGGVRREPALGRRRAGRAGAGGARRSAYPDVAGDQYYQAALAGAGQVEHRRRLSSRRSSAPAVASCEHAGRRRRAGRGRRRRAGRRPDLVLGRRRPRLGRRPEAVVGGAAQLSGGAAQLADGVGAASSRDRPARQPARPRSPPAAPSWPRRRPRPARARPSLTVGLDKLVAGGATLSAGLKKASSGGDKLAGALDTGASAIPAFTRQARMARARMMSAPVDAIHRAREPGAQLRHRVRAVLHPARALGRRADGLLPGASARRPGARLAPCATRPWRSPDSGPACVITWLQAVIMLRRAAVRSWASTPCSRWRSTASR